MWSYLESQLPESDVAALKAALPDLLYVSPRNQLGDFNGTNNVVSEGIFKNGKKVGIWKVADKNGELKDVNMNKQGKKFQKRVKPLDKTQN